MLLPSLRWNSRLGLRRRRSSAGLASAGSEPRSQRYCLSMRESDVHRPGSLVSGARIEPGRGIPPCFWRITA